MIITIDGPAGSGKSAAALMLAQRLGAAHLDTGAMYRAVALWGLQNQLLDNPAALAQACQNIDLRFDWSTQPARVLLAGQDVSDAIRRPEVTAVTHVPADNIEVRKVLVELQRAIGRQTKIRVTEGRDQGSVVFPRAEFKFYLDAKAEERARRRIAQMAEKGIVANAAEVLRQIVERDARDQARVVGGLVQTKDAIVIDTSPLTLQEVVEKMLALVQAGPTGGRP
ncbi:MAG: (d)CMP kinase [Phycisphaerae bacterium]